MQKIGQSAQQAMQQVKQLASAIDSLHDKTITITVNITGPGVGYLQKGGLLFAQHGAAITGTGKTFVTSRRMHYGNAVIGEAGKPELVVPLTKNLGDLGDKKVDIPAALMRLAGKKPGSKKTSLGGESDDSKATKVAFITPPPEAPAARSTKREFTVRHKVENNVPVNLIMDGRKIMSTVQRQLLEFSDASV